MLFFATVTVMLALLGASSCQDFKTDYLSMVDDLGFQSDYGLWKPIDTVKEGKGCCLPKEMEVMEGMMLAEARGRKEDEADCPGEKCPRGPKMIMGNIQVAISAKKNMTFSNIYLNINGKGMHLNVYQDFSKLVQYNVDMKTGKCKKSRVSYRPFCMPDGSKVLGNVYFGNQKGANHINSTWYQVTDKKARSVGFVAMMSTGKANECVPVTESAYGSAKGVSYALTIDFMNFKPKVTDMSVFNIPDQCKQEEQLVPAVNPFGGSVFFN